MSNPHQLQPDLTVVHTLSLLPHSATFTLFGASYYHSWIDSESQTPVKTGVSL